MTNFQASESTLAGRERAEAFRAMRDASLEVWVAKRQ